MILSLPGRPDHNANAGSTIEPEPDRRTDVDGRGRSGVISFWSRMLICPLIISTHSFVRVDRDRSPLGPESLPKRFFWLHSLKFADAVVGFVFEAAAPMSQPPLARSLARFVCGALQNAKMKKCVTDRPRFSPHLVSSPLFSAIQKAPKECQK